jgi:hypothetical protein
MILLLDSFFTTGFEKEEARQQFFDMRMGDQGYESFIAFKARFLERASNGGIKREEWYQHMWNKITPRLRDISLPIKNTWREDFEAMIQTLLAIDQEHIRTFQRRRRQDNTSELGSKEKPRTFGTYSDRNRTPGTSAKIAEIELNVDSDENRDGT